MASAARRPPWEQFWLLVFQAIVHWLALLVFTGCAPLPQKLPTSPGVDHTGVWLPFWVIALAIVPLIVVAFYFGLRKISQPFLKFLFLMYTAFVAAQAGLLWSNGVSITGRFVGNVPLLSRTSPDDALANDATKSAANANADGTSDISPTDRRQLGPAAKWADFAFRVQLRQAGGELALVTGLFAGLGLWGWRRRHADAETTAATLVRGKLSIGDLHVGVLNAVSGNFLIAWAVRKIQPNQVSVAALSDQTESVYFLPARFWHMGSLEVPLVKFVNTYARDAEALTEHLVSLAEQNSQRAQEALAQVVREMPVEARLLYKVALPDKLIASDRQIRGA